MSLNFYLVLHLWARFQCSARSQMSRQLCLCRLWSPLSPSFRNNWAPSSARCRASSRYLPLGWPAMAPCDCVCTSLPTTSCFIRSPWSWLSQAIKDPLLGCWPDASPDLTTQLFAADVSETLGAARACRTNSLISLASPASHTPSAASMSAASSQGRRYEHYSVPRHQLLPIWGSRAPALLLQLSAAIDPFRSP